jgi:hypothetical protein
MKTVSYKITVQDKAGKPLQEISGIKEIPESLKGEPCKHVQLYFHGLKPSVSPYKSIVAMELGNQAPASIDAAIDAANNAAPPTDDEPYTDHPATAADKPKISLTAIKAAKQ